MRVTIVIPTYNERENLRPLVERIAAVAAHPLFHFALPTSPRLRGTSWASRDKSLPLPAGRGENLEWTVLVVDDSSPDGTGALAEELVREGEKPVRISVLHRPRKDGLGAALLAGFHHVLNASGRMTYYECGRTRDMSPPAKPRATTDATDVIVQMDADGSHEPEEIPAMLAHIRDGVDVVIGSRRVLGGRITGWGIHRQLMSWAAQTLSRHLLGLRTRDVTSGFRAWRADALARVLEATPVYGS